METDPVLTVRVNGCFEARGPNGTKRSPKGARARAILALLALSEGAYCGRERLRVMFWPDRPLTQGSGSLRQALNEIRRALGPHRELLETDRTRVRLHRTTVEEADRSLGNFLEDISVQTPGFLEWRNGFFADAAPERISAVRAVDEYKIGLVLETLRPDLEIYERALGDVVSRNLKELLQVETIENPRNPQSVLYVVSVQSLRMTEGCVGVRASVTHPQSGDTVWSNIIEIPLRGAPEPRHPSLMKLANALTSKLTTLITENSGALGAQDSPAHLTRFAQSAIFSMQPTNFDKAEAALNAAIAHSPRGLHHGLLAQLCVIRHVECVSSREDLRERSEAACARALELEPDNSDVLAAVANSRLILNNNVAASGELSRMAVKSNHANPLAWWAMSSAQLYAGRFKEARACALRARLLSESSQFRFWTEFQFALTSAVLGRFDEAVRSCELSSSLNPNFRPPLRYLSAIYSKSKLFPEAMGAFTRLSAKEPDLTPSRFADHDYPVSLMRNQEMLDVGALEAALACDIKPPFRLSA